MSDPSARSGTGEGARRTPLHRKRSARRWLWPAVSVVGFGGALAIVASIVAFYVHSDQGGAALRRQFQQTQPAAAPTTAAPRSAAHTTAITPCSETYPTTPGKPGGIVEAASIGLDAPVVQGDSDPQLADAVGHVPASSWPDQTGTTVLVAHDVSWFSRIDHLHRGQTIAFVSHCTTRWYKVTGSSIVQAGSPVYNTSTPRLVLVTCYPLDALFLTPQRYELTAVLSRVTFGGRAATVPARGLGTVPTSLPASVAAQVAPRVTTTAPLGQLTLSGHPSPTWSQSEQPLNASGSALELYFGALQVAETAPSSWNQLAPSVPASTAQALDGATVVGVPGSVTPTLFVSGSTVTGATVQSAVTLSGGSAPGTYSITMTAAIRHGRLTVIGWRVAS